ncbi:MAG: aldehyde dehydrogenase family protein [Candidatus Dormibacteria bacterium]
MARPVAKTYKLLIAGAFVRSESGRSYPTPAGINVPRASRKDLREAVRVARAALPGWSGRTAYNRGQVLYRVAEVLSGRSLEFARALGGGRAGARQVAAAIDHLVFYAGCADKLAQLGGSVNQVAGPYFNFTIPEPVGVVAVVAPGRPALLPLAAHLAASLCGGNVAIGLVSEEDPVPGLLLGEALASGDLPPGSVALLSGNRTELLPWLGSHRDLDLVDALGCTADQARELQVRAAASVKRVLLADQVGPAPSPRLALQSLELKTVWHPVGV